MRLAVCIPFRAYVPAACAAKLMMAWSEAGDAWRDIHGEGSETILISSYHAPSVDEARRRMAAQCMDHKADYVLWIDDDAVCPHDLLKRLWESMQETGASMIAPIFCKKAPPFDVTCFWLDKENGGFTECNVYPARLFEADATGFHTILMKTDVLRDFKDAVDGPLFHKAPNMGEDIYFTQIAKQHLGHTLWIDSRIEVGHMAMFTAYPKMGKEYKEKHGSHNEGSGLQAEAVGVPAAHR